MPNQFNVHREDGSIRFTSPIDEGSILLTDDEAANLGAWLGATVDITGGRNFEEWQAIMREKQG